MIFQQKVKAVLGLSLISGTLYAECKPPLKTPRTISSQKEVYQGQPFYPGEKASYEVHYFGVLVGYGHLEVRNPVKYSNNWLQHFVAHASTGDWYRAIFVAKDYAMAYSSPQNFAIKKFYIKQDEGKMFGSRFIQEKWLTFNHQNCKVLETIKKPEKPAKIEKAELNPGAIDALGVIYKIRTLDFEIGKMQKLLVYSSQKNWWLEAKPVAIEQIKVPAGEFQAFKLKLQTYIGKELQQKGDVFAWIAKNHPNRPLVKLTGEIKIGNVVMELKSFYTPKTEMLIKAPEPVKPDRYLKPEPQIEGDKQPKN
ncbi:MAG: DUF3108 domain-containing protein [Oligoflexales bacterium]